MAKRLAVIETCVVQFRRDARLDRLRMDIREQRFIEHTLQIAIRAAIDVTSHVASDERLGEPSTNRALFTLLARPGWITPPLGDTLHRMVGFRNVLVLGYEDVNLAVVEDVAANHLDDLLAFAEAVRTGFPESKGSLRGSPPTTRGFL